MTAALGTLALALLAGLGFASLGALVAAPAWLALRARLARRHPALRAQAALLAASAPALLAAGLVALCFAPGVLGLLGLHADHCTQHPGHPHLCLVHPTALLTLPQAFLLLLAGAGLAATTWRAVGGARRWREELARLRLGAAETLAPDVLRVDSARPFSLTAGLGRPEIFVSDALARALPPEQMAVVLAHERAHVRRRDGLRRLAASWLSRLHLPWVRRAILAELDLATEQACDEASARQVGDRLRVAETLLAVERLVADGRAPDGTLLAFGASRVPERVRSLVAEPRPAGSLRGAALAAGALGLAAAGLADPLHHATEHVLGLIFGLR